MCLITPTKIPYVAQEDIFCYKVLGEVNGQLVTPFRRFPITLGKIYTTDNVSEAKSNELGEGFLHAYTSPNYMYKSKRDFDRHDRAKIAMYLAVIPKGSKFFTNNDCTEVCATALKVIKKVADIEDKPLFNTIATDVKEEGNRFKVNKTFDNYKHLLTTMEGVVKYAKDNSLYSDIIRKYEIFDDGSYEKNLYAYRLIVAVLTENEENSLTSGECYYPYVDFYNGRGYWSPGANQVKVGTIISGGTSYIVVGGTAGDGAGAGLGGFNSDSGVSGSWANVGFRSVSSLEIARFISKHFGRLVFDLMYGCSNCKYRWADDDN